MGIRIFNTLTNNKEDFMPLRDKEVSMYVCGPTVYDEPHIGHARSAYIFDVIRRYFIYKGYKVKFVRNVTDVDDKIINKAREEFEGEELKDTVNKVSLKYLDFYHKAMDGLGIMPPDEEPKATRYIEKMKDFIAVLIQRGMAYEAGGDVYFDVRKAKDYGKLSNQNLQTLEAGSRIAPGENKKDPLDFALWKAAKEREVSWPSPWGEGRPGWHIECSVMSVDILGDEFDIHGGGIDLIFPHHENELAQSEGAGKKFARYWVHNGLLTINKEKMAKSLGNFVTIDEVLERYSPDILKILFLQAHYSHPVDFSWERMEEAKKAYEHIEILREKLKKVILPGQGTEQMLQFKQQFDEAMDDDFNTPRGLGILFDMVNRCNRLIDAEDGMESSVLRYAMDVIKDISEVFGLTFEQKEKKLAKTKGEIENLLELRDKARQNKDFTTADRIRQELDKAGIILEDGKDGTSWRVR